MFWLIIIYLNNNLNNEAIFMDILYSFITYWFWKSTYLIRLWTLIYDLEVMYFCWNQHLWDMTETVIFGSSAEQACVTYIYCCGGPYFIPGPSFSCVDQPAWAFSSCHPLLLPPPPLCLLPPLPPSQSTDIYTSSVSTNTQSSHRVRIGWVHALQNLGAATKTGANTDYIQL